MQVFVCFVFSGFTTNYLLHNVFIFHLFILFSWYHSGYIFLRLKMYICTCIVQSFIPSSYVSEAIFSGATFIV